MAYLPQTRELLNEYCVAFPDETRPYGSARLPDSDDVLAKWMALIRSSTCSARSVPRSTAGRRGGAWVHTGGQRGRMDTSGAVATGMPWHTARGLGSYGERMAVRYLTDRGLEVLDRNWRCDLGEIDIVARDGGCLVVCEVKTRRSTTFGQPIEAVDHRKLDTCRNQVDGT